MVQEISAKTFEQKVLKTGQPVLVEVWAPWCKPCQAMAPVLEAVAQKFKGQAHIYKLNADQNPDLVRQYRVMGIPTLLFFRHGRLVDRKMGLQDEPAITRRLTPLLEMSAETAAAQEITGLFRWPRRKMVWLGIGTTLLAAGVLWQWLF
ncbi:MAG: thioredoxin [Chloroflexi bacterium]|nr:MAG: thioredoxin [Chloroflexota bacterium]